MAGTTDILEPDVDEQEPPAPSPIPNQAPPPQPPSGGPGQQPPAKTPTPNYGLKDDDKQKIAQIIVKMQQAGEPDSNIKSAVKRFIEINTAPPPTPVDKGIRQTTQNLSQPLQFNGTFQPDLEGEKNGLYLNDPDYQAQKKDFVSKIATDQNGVLLYPEQDAKGNWSNYYTKQPLQNFDPHSMQGKILQVPRPYQAATGGQQFITPKYDWDSNSYKFPGVQTPDVPTEQTLPQATVYGTKNRTQVADDREKSVRQQYPEISNLHDSKFVDDILDKNKDKNFVQRYLNPSTSPVIKNDDGSVSTHRMASSDNLAYPTIVQQPDGSLKQLGDKEAYQYAIKSGEYIKFKNDKDADWFATNGYKLGNQTQTSDDNSIPPIDNSKFQQPMARDNTPVQQPVQPKVDLTQTTADQLAKKQALAQTVIQKELTSNPDVARKVINQEKQQNQFQQGIDDFMSKPLSDQPLTNAQKEANRLTPVQPTPTASDQDVTDFLNLAQTDPNAVRGFLNHIIDQKPDKAPALKSAVYVNDAAARATADPTKAGKILQNAQQIEKGQLDYSPTNGLLTKPEGVWESIASGAAQKTKAFQDYDTFANATPEQAIQELEKRRAAYDPDEPIPAPKGFLASKASVLAAQPIKGLVAGKVAGGVTGLIPGAKEFAPAADQFVSAAVSSNDFRKMSYANSLQQNYNQLRNEGMSPQDAYQKANGQAKDESMVDAIAGGAMMYGAGAIGEIPLPKFSLSAPFTSTLVTALKQGAKGVGEAGAMGLIQGAAQDVKNKLADEKGIQHDTTGQDITDAIKSGTMFTLGLGVLAKGMDMMIGATKSKLLQGLSKATPEQVNQELGGLIMDGHITPQEAQAASTAITEHRLTDASIPPNVTDDARLQIQDKIKRRDYLETQLESADKAFHPEIKEKINTVNDDILELAKNTKPRGEEDILSQKPTTDGQTENAAAQTEGQVNSAGGAQPASGSGAPSIQPVSDQIQPTSDFRTWDLGDMEGKPEDEAAKKHIEGVVEKWDTKPATDATDPAKQGETFGGEFLQRIIPAFDNVLKTGEPNTTITTHSSDLKAFKVWDEMGRPDITKLTDEQKKEFATRYNQQETYNGDLETFKGDKGDIHVIRHGETTANEKNIFRSGDTNLTAKGKQQAAESGRELGRVTGGDVPKIITSDLPRAVDTSNIIHGELNGDKPQVGALAQSPHFEGERKITHVGNDHVVVQDPGGDHIKHEIPISDIKTSDNARNLSGDQGQVSGTGNAAETSQNPRSENISSDAQQKAEPSKTTEQTRGATEPSGSEAGQSDDKLVGPSHGALKKLAAKLGLPDVERGTHLTPEEYADRGRQLLDGGADIKQVEQDFKNGKQPSADDISIARAHLEDLAKKAFAIGDEKGTQGDEYKAAKNEMQQWRDEVVKPMGTKTSEPFTALQGQRDLDTGSFTAIKNAKEDVTGKPVESLPSDIHKLSEKVKDLEDKNNELQGKLQDALNRDTGKTTKPDVKKLSGRLSDLAKRIRTSSEFDNFLKGPLSDVKKMGVDLPRVKEIAASILEDAAKAVKAGEDAAEFIKNAVDKLKDDLDKDKFIDALTKIVQKTGLFDTKETPEEKNVRRLEKQLEELQQ